MTALPPLRLWTCVLAIAALPPLLAVWADRPATPLPADAPPTEFSEARARPVVEELAGRIGHRLAGSAGARRGEEHLVARLREIPGLEVEVQDVEGVRGRTRYRVRNVLARLAGDEPAAVLVSAHYDSALGSVGAADDLVGVASAIEIARALAAGPRPRHSVVFNLNEGEELGLYGAHGFLEHRWAEDVIAFVNLEAGGSGGRPMLFQAGSAPLVHAYGRGAPHPHGSVFAQDVFESGIIPSDTDYRIYTEDGGLPGLDLSLYQDGWAYHTHLDRPERLERGSLQEMGANALGFVREMAAGELPGGEAGEPPVFFDLLGLVLVRYSHATAHALALLALVVTGFALLAGARAQRLAARTVLLGLALNGLVLCVAVLLPLALAWLTAGILDRPFGWYPRPWLAVVAFGAPTLGVVLAAHGVIAAPWAARAEGAGVALGDSARAMLLASQPVVACLVLVPATLVGLGSAYAALWWALPGAVALRICVTHPHRPLVALAVGYVPGALVTSQLAVALVTNFVPMAGRMSLSMDYVIAGMVALPAAICGLAAAPALHHVPSRLWQPAAGALLALGAAATGYMAVADPSTPERPRRIGFAVMDDAEGRELWVWSKNALPLGDAAAALPGADPETQLHKVETDLPVPPAAGIEVVSAADGPGEDRRTYAVRIEPNGAYHLQVRLATDDPLRAADAGYVSPPEDGWLYELEAPRGPAELLVTATHAALPPAVAEFVRGLPEHLAPTGQVFVKSRVTLSR